MQDNPKLSESLLDEYLETGQRENAVELLYKLAILSVKKKDFTKAETYRDRLYEIDSFALAKIVGVNEAIEEEKSKALTSGFRQLWAPFFDGLSAEEANAFFFALKEQRFNGEKMVLEQGKPNDRLYLVNEGQLKVIYSDQEKELLIHSLGRGDFFGHETLFSVNVCTASVRTLVDSRLSFIDRATLEGMKGPLEAMASKLKKVCSCGITTFDRLRRKGIDRRSFKRINYNTQVTFQMLASNNQAAMQRSVKAELWDISKGGLSFYFQSKNREAVRRLTGRVVGVRLRLDDMDKQRAIAVTGVVHGVENHPLDEYSVHVKLQRRFSDSAIRTIQAIAGN